MNMKKLNVITTFAVLMILQCVTATANEDKATMNSKKSACPDYLNHSYRKLHSTKEASLCDMSSGKVLLVVNTASHCGFTPQFEGLEALHKKYADQGLKTVGFASNDFNQETKDEAKSAGICFENFGVSFTMLAATQVTGAEANPTFQYLNEKTSQPSWNFNKYLVNLETGEVEHFSSQVNPTESELEQKIVKLLSEA